MSVLSLGTFAALVLSTSFLSGVFGMAGGMVLMGGLIFLVSVPVAMVLHGITQMTSNGWRAVLWLKHVEWRVVLRYGLGLALASVLFSLFRFIPDQWLVLLSLGILPFVTLVMPARLVPQVRRTGGAELCGFICTSLQFLSGVSGPVLDSFFVREAMDRRSVVATKAASQTLTHLAKLVYFGSQISGGADAVDLPVIIVAVVLAVTGTTLSRSVLEKLSDRSFQQYTRWIVAVIGVIYLARGSAELLR